MSRPSTRCRCCRPSPPPRRRLRSVRYATREPAYDTDDLRLGVDRDRFEPRIIGDEAQAPLRIPESLYRYVAVVPDTGHDDLAHVGGLLLADEHNVGGPNTCADHALPLDRQGKARRGG